MSSSNEPGRPGARYMLRVQLDQRRSPDDAASRLLRLVKTATADEVCLFFFAEELNHGHETLEEIDGWIARARPVHDALRRHGVRVSVNPWHTLLHADRGRSLKADQRWQRMVDPHGHQATAQVCPLDVGWREYYAETMRRYAAEEFNIIWIDDDLRFHNHHPLHWGGCFCPLHLDEFEARHGIHASREEIVDACLSPGPAHPWRSRWLSMWDETNVELVASWREIAAAHGVRLGLMSSPVAAHTAEGRQWHRWFAALDQDRPIHRPAFWPYAEATAAVLPAAMIELDAQRSLRPEAVSVPEIENLPYGTWNKPLVQVGAQLTLAQILGASGLAISMYDFMGNDDGPGPARFLAAWRPTLDWLATLFPPALTTTGVYVPWSPDTGRHVTLATNSSWSALGPPLAGWGRWLESAGIACTTRRDGSVVALSGISAQASTDDEIRRWLSGGLLLDGGAALVLAQRGYSGQIGLTDVRSVAQDDLLYSIESSDRYTPRRGAEIGLNFGPHCLTIAQGIPDPDAEIASVLLGPRRNLVGHGLVRYTNSAGGTVATVPWSADSAVTMNALRAFQLARTVQSLGSEALVVSGHAWLVPVALTDDAGQWGAVIWNASPDDTDEVEVELPDGVPDGLRAVHVMRDGTRINVGLRGGRIILPRPLRQWEMVVLHSASQ